MHDKFGTVPPNAHPVPRVVAVPRPVATVLIAINLAWTVAAVVVSSVALFVLGTMVLVVGPDGDVTAGRALLVSMELCLATYLLLRVTRRLFRSHELSWVPQVAAAVLCTLVYVHSVMWHR